MRYSEGHKESVSARIVEETARALRRQGIDRVSIAALMKRVGLTHGGFYAHFRDRSDLFAQAVARAGAQSVLQGDRPAAQAFADYLSSAHAAHPEDGCLVAALGAEGARQKGRLRRAFAEVARGFLQSVEQKLHPKSTKSAKNTLSDEALVTASRLVGALVLARLVHDPALAERILSAVQRDL